MTRPSLEKGLNSISTAATTVAAFLPLLLLIVFATYPAHAQTYSVIYSFTGGADGGNPSMGGLTMDSAGNLYGTTYYGGYDCQQEYFATGCGTAFELSHTEAGWTFTTIYTFGVDPNDGRNPIGRLVIESDGSLYGATYSGGTPSCSDPGTYVGCGTIYKLALQNGSWTETILYRFQGETDGAQPMGGLLFDRAGNVYGATLQGGYQGYPCSGYGCGTIFELIAGGGAWNESVLHSFKQSDNTQSGVTDGEFPNGDLAFDTAGNLYGTTVQGGANGAGSIFRLRSSASGWTEDTIYSFDGNDAGEVPQAGLTADNGNLYGDTYWGAYGQVHSNGAVFELSGLPDEPYLNVLYSGFTSDYGASVAGPFAPVALGSDRDVFGTTWLENDSAAVANQFGTVFKLSAAGDAWIRTTLHVFTGQVDGSHPQSTPLLAPDGKIYGTTHDGGVGICRDQGFGCGVVWEITP